MKRSSVEALAARAGEPAGDADPGSPLRPSPGDRMALPVVVPLDTSVFASSVLPHARALARRAGAAIHLVRVQGGRRPGGEDENELASRHRRRDAWESYLADVARYFHAQLGPARVHTVVLDEPSVVEGLAAYARSERVSVVVMSANGLASDGYARGLATAVRTSMACGLPVMLVPPGSPSGGARLETALIALSNDLPLDRLAGAIDAVAGDRSLRCRMLHLPEACESGVGGASSHVAAGPPDAARGPARHRDFADELRRRGHQVPSRARPDAVSTDFRAETPLSAADLLVVGASNTRLATGGSRESVASRWLTERGSPLLIVSPDSRRESVPADAALGVGAPLPSAAW